MTTRVLFAAALFALAAPAIAQKAEIYTSWGTAIRGYDPVGFFTEGKPVEGSRQFTHKWKGATWRFASAQSRDAFAAAPEKYAPQYGGYCAWAVSRGYTAKGDPRHWKIVGGKLYLNYDARVQKDWERDIPGNIANSEKQWPKVLEK